MAHRCPAWVARRRWLYLGNFRLIYGVSGQNDRGKSAGLGPVTAARIIRIVFGLVAGMMLVAALGNVVLSGHLTIVTPVSFGALLAVALAFLINNLLTARERHNLLT